jgi:hydrogenase maturation protease
MNAKVVLIGSGNTFFKDEGIGLYAAKYLKENFTFDPALDIIDGGTLGFGLMPLLQEYDAVIIANTSSEDDKIIGSIDLLSGEELIANQGIKKTANEVEITEMLQICSMANHCAQVTTISIVPEDILSVEVGITSALRDKWVEYIDVITGELNKWGIDTAKKESIISLDEILDQFANPSIEHGKGF